MAHVSRVTIHYAICIARYLLRSDLDPSFNFTLPAEHTFPSAKPTHLRMFLARRVLT